MTILALLSIGLNLSRFLGTVLERNAQTPYLFYFYFCMKKEFDRAQAKGGS